MCIGTCKRCGEEICAGDAIASFYDGDKLFHKECCPVESDYIEAFGGASGVPRAVHRAEGRKKQDKQKSGYMA